VQFKLYMKNILDNKPGLSYTLKNVVLLMHPDTYRDRVLVLQIGSQRTQRAPVSYFTFSKSAANLFISSFVSTDPE